MLRVGLLGAGRIGAVHARSISEHPGSDLVAIADENVEQATAVSTAFGGAVRSVDDILADTEIDAVLIATPTHTHVDLIEAATGFGNAVLCEKPVDLDLTRAMACDAAMASADHRVMMGFNRRFDPNFRTLKAEIDANSIGRRELLALTSFDPEPPPLAYVKVSGGLFRDMMIHDFDMVHYLMGDLPHSVSVVASALVDSDIAAAGDVDTAIATLKFEDGRLAVIKNSRRAAYGYDQRIELLGSGGLLQAQNVLENTVVKSTNTGVTGAKPQHFFLERYRHSYAAEWRAFVEAVETQSPMPVTLADGVAALRMAEAAVLSHERGVPVALEEVG